MEKRFVKIVHDEGVIFEAELSTEREADAFILGYHAALSTQDIDDPDDTYICKDDQPAKDEE